MNKSTVFQPLLILFLPDVAIREVLRQLELPTIYHLSLCSTRTKQKLKRNMFKVEELWISISENKVMPSIRIGPTFYNVFASALDLHKCFRSIKMNSTVTPRIQIGSKFFKAVTLNTTRSEDAEPEDSKKLKEVHGYLCDLFRVPLSVKWDQHYKPFEFFEFSPREDMFVKFKDRIDAKLFEPGTLTRCQFNIHPWNSAPCDFTASQHRLQLLIITKTTGYGPDFLPLHKELLSVPAIIHDDANHGSQLFFVYSQGKHRLLKNILLQNFYVMAFMRHWAMQQSEDLETFIAIQGYKLFDPSGVLEMLENAGGIENTKMEKWDPARRERFYPYRSIISEYHTFEPGTFDCKDGIDIVRKADGKRATVKISSQYFMFFVWK